MLRMTLAVGFCVILAAISAQAQPSVQPDIKLDLAYGPDPAQRLDLCRPAAGQPGPHPGVVMIHGGYWTMGDKSMYAQLCKGAASEGMVAAAINYRLANDDPHNRWPAQLVDAQLAVRWLRAHAAEYGINPAHICALGDSAGGQLAVFLAALDRPMPGDHAGELAGISSSVACAVDNFGPVDLSADTYWPPDQKLFGNQDRTEVKDQERSASPIFVVGPHTAPLMIAHGRDDKAVSLEQSTQLADRLKSLHVPVKMVVLNAGHEFSGLPPQELGTILQQELDFIKSARPR